MNFYELIPALPEIILAIGILGFVLAAAFKGEEDTSFLSYLAIALLGVVLISHMMGKAFATNTFYGVFAINSFLNFFKTLLILGAILVLLISTETLKEYDLNKPEYPLLILFATLGMLLMVSANGLMVMYLGLELQSLTLYILAAFRRNCIRATEAGVKYFVLGGVASGILLFGVSLVYGFTGATNFDSLSGVISHTTPSIGFIIGLTLVIMGLAFKASLAPFHMWTPDVYEGTPTPVTAYFASVPKISIIVVLSHMLMVVFSPLAIYWQNTLMVLAILSLTVGSFAALVQTDLKRLLAYSSINHMGYLMVGIIANSGDALMGIMIYMFVYFVSVVGVFSCILVLLRDGKQIEAIDDLKGLSKQEPALSFCLAAFLLSMAGIPPLAGFFGKFYIFMAAVESGFIILAVVAVMLSVVAAYYYLKIVKLMYFEEEEEGSVFEIRGRASSVVLISTSIITLFFFVFQVPLLNYTRLLSIEFFGQ